MNTRLKFLGLLLSFVSLNLFGQSYVGGIDYQGSYQYIKIACTDGNCKFSMPYMDGDKKFDVTGNIQTNSTWSFNRDFEKWEARSSFNEKRVMEGIIKFPTGQQPFLLREQKKALSQQEMAQYIGFFNDSQNRKVLVYERFNYLHLISPYSEEVMSLKPIGNNSFWSVSGEESRFSNPVSGKFQDLLIKDRFGNETKLRRIPDPIIQEKYVTIGNDSIYTKMYIPTATGQGKTPACLILPGGGATGNGKL